MASGEIYVGTVLRDGVIQLKNVSKTNRAFRKYFMLWLIQMNLYILICAI